MRVLTGEIAFDKLRIMRNERLKFLLSIMLVIGRNVAARSEAERVLRQRLAEVEAKIV